MKKSPLIIFLLCFCLFLTGCSEEAIFPPAETEEPTQAIMAPEQKKLTEFKICYDSRDSLTPFEATSTVNIQLMNLIYDPLFKMDSAYQPQPFLADSAKQDGLKLTVSLKYQVPFSKSGYMTANDVVYSFYVAAKSAHYGEQLAVFASAEPSGEDKVIFTLKHPEPYAVSLLTFPIVKRESSGQPEGTGRYSLKQDENGRYLAANPNWFMGEVSFERIEMVDTLNGDRAVGALEDGKISYLFQDFNDGIYRRVNTGTMPVQLNNMVFLGMSQKNPLLADTNIRLAITASVNKKELAYEAFYGYAVAAGSPFNPYWYALDGTEDADVTYSPTEAAELLKRSGFTQTDETGTRFNEKERLHLRLLVNKNNIFRRNTADYIVSQLAAVGIEIELIELNWDAYTEALQKGDFDLYIGEIKLKNNMDLSPFLTVGGAASYGIIFPNNVSAAYDTFLTGGLSVSELVHAFDEAALFLPLCYRTGFVAYSRNLSGNILTVGDDIYYNIQEWLH